VYWVKGFELAVVCVRVELVVVIKRRDSVDYVVGSEFCSTLVLESCKLYEWCLCGTHAVG
jgi:hypothetical protein